MIASHFNTNKHKKRCISIANASFKEEFGTANNLSEAFDKKCKELREIKKLNYEYKEEVDKYKEELDKLKKKNEILQEINIKYQLQNEMIDKKTSPICDNLIDI